MARLFFPVLLLLTSHTAWADLEAGQARFWQNLAALCGQAFEGRLTAFDKTVDADWLSKRMVIHVRRCAPNEIHIPLFVGDDRSRTWVVTRLADGLRLKHDHRHEDGSEDAVTWYGGRTTDPGRAWRQAFPVDDYSKALFLAHELPGSVTNIWYMEVRPGKHFAYGLTRQGRHLRAEFDLTRPVSAPPAPWGHEEDPVRD